MNYKVSIIFWILLLWIFISCQLKHDQSFTPQLRMSENKRVLEYQDGTPFLWLGGTTWGMPEWMTREEVDYYLDNRKSKGFTVVQICLFWGKREEDPVTFHINPLNPYGHKAFDEIDGKPISTKPLIVKGGSSQNPNDYWDHVYYILEAASQREMMVALLPVWGRRYVNATHTGFSQKVFSKPEMRSFGEFLGDRLKVYKNIIWVLGGDVAADLGGDYLGHYRSMAEGIITGITNEKVAWNEESPLWDQALMTYHPDGKPMLNSSQWFHNDPWLDFNMIETHKHRDSVYAAVLQDYSLENPIKPTVMGEPAYEGEHEPYPVSTGIHMRRQAYQTFFAGAAGITYGGFRDKNGNGPLFSPFKGWEKLLELEGANSMKIIKQFCQEHNWPNWSPVQNVVIENAGSGELQKVAVKTIDGKLLVYFPDNSEALIDVSDYVRSETINVSWFNSKTGIYAEIIQLESDSNLINISPPKEWNDAIFVLKR